jgi:hypothetical protein
MQHSSCHHITPVDTAAVSNEPPFKMQQMCMITANVVPTFTSWLQLFVKPAYQISSAWTVMFF